MEPKYSQIFNKQTLKSLNNYCEINKIEDVDGFIKKCFESGFNIERYGLLEKTLNEGEKQVINEIIVEKRVEVPIEIIKEVILEKEIIKEVPVEKIVTVYDKSGENELGEKITKLEEEMSKKNEELDELRRTLDEKLDNTNEKMLQETLQKLRKEILDKNEKIKELERINKDLENTKQPIKGFFMRGSNLNDTL